MVRGRYGIKTEGALLIVNILSGLGCHRYEIVVEVDVSPEESSLLLFFVLKIYMWHVYCESGKAFDSCFSVFSLFESLCLSFIICFDFFFLDQICGRRSVIILGLHQLFFQLPNFFLSFWSC